MIRPLEHTGDSANIAYYRERGARPHEPYVWCTVLRSMPWRRGPGGAIEIGPGPVTYRIAVYRSGADEIGTTTVERPRGRAPAHLPTRTIARHVRAVLEGDR